MRTLVFLLEEESAKNMLLGIIPRLFPVGYEEHIDVKYITFNGKCDLERQLVKRIRGWCIPNSFFIILRDKDSDDCIALKSRLLNLVSETNKSDNCLIRIACHELESFFLGDLSAVATGFAIPAIANKQRKKPYRTPDNISNAAEELGKLTFNKYAKLSGSRAIAPHLKLDGTNRSHSFCVLINSIKQQYNI